MLLPNRADTPSDLSDLLSQVDVSAPSVSKFDQVKAWFAQRARLDPRRIAVYYVSKPSNLDVRFRQPGALTTRPDLAIAIIPPETNIDRYIVPARRHIQRRTFTRFVLVSGEGSSWYFVGSIAADEGVDPTVAGIVPRELVSYVSYRDTAETTTVSKIDEETRPVGGVAPLERDLVVEELFDGLPTGVEKEQPDENLEINIERPFDPERIKVIRETKTISLLLTRIDHGEIDLAPEFQRRARIWDIGRKSRLIESLLLRIPLPVFYVASDAAESWSVVDGLQRLTTIQDYCHDDFKLKGMEYLVQLEGCRFSSLPRNMQRRIEETELVINVIQPGTPEEVMFNIFSRINTGGITLNGQEIRHALHKGPARKFLQDLATGSAFSTATCGSVSDHRMAARECVLRFMAFWMKPWEEYSVNDLDGYLSSAMQRLNEVDEQTRRRYQADFERAMNCAWAIFGDDAFRKRYDPNAPRSPVSKPLFEAWSVNLARRAERDLTRLAERADRVRRTFIEVMSTDREFEVAISYATGVPRRVHKRFDAIEALIQQALL